MSFLDKLFSRKPKPGTRVRICVECGMPLAEHKDWCSILRTQQEMDAKAKSGGEIGQSTVGSRQSGVISLSLSRQSESAVRVGSPSRQSESGSPSR